MPGAVIISIALILQDHATYLIADDGPLESGFGVRRVSTTAESREFGQQYFSKEARDRSAVDRGHGVARALETVLLNTQLEDKAPNMSLVLDISQQRLTL